VNDLGFILMRDDKKKEAVEVFKFNLSMFPNSANAYNSLAEGYQATGEKDLAIKNFKKTVELDPKNTYAADRLKELEKSTQ
jgi:Tfp pilus assembly protein PilF